MRQRFGIAQALLGAPKLVIVDEPTAGLDPDERNRFLNLLARIGENVVVILSTHIVEDVTDLCPRMAMIAKGRVLIEGAPQAAIATLRDRVWRRSVSDGELAEYQQRCTVLSSRLVGGRPQINVYADSQPDGRLPPRRAGPGRRLLPATAGRLRRTRCGRNFSVSICAISCASPLLWVIDLAADGGGLPDRRQQQLPAGRRHRQRASERAVWWWPTSWAC